MCVYSLVHVGKRPIHVLYALVLFDILAEGAVAVLHIRKLVLILDEELTTVVAHIYCNIWHYILEVPLRVVRVEVRVILNVHLLKAHIS